jgi:hypothetical protein
LIFRAPCAAAESIGRGARTIETVTQSLTRTWVALAVAALTVLVVAVVTGRDFFRDVDPPCPGSVRQDTLWSTRPSDLEPVLLETGGPSDLTVGPSFYLAYDWQKERGYGYPGAVRNVRVVWKEPGGETGCTCGTVPIALSGEAVSDLRLFRVRGTRRYVVQGRAAGYSADYEASLRAAFVLGDAPARHVQTDRIFAPRHLPFYVALFALAALGLALVPARRAIAYARTIHAWTEATLRPGGLLESAAGGTLGTLEQTRRRVIAPGPVLVAFEALATSGLYRDVPIVQRRHLAEGDHARWASGTMRRLRDARALAIVATACALLALGARLIA